MFSPSPQPSHRGRGRHAKVLYQSPLPSGEGQGEGTSWHDFELMKTFETASAVRPDLARRGAGETTNADERRQRPSPFSIPPAKAGIQELPPFALAPDETKIKLARCESSLTEVGAK